MLHVTCALIEQAGKILICQRSERMKLPLKWEFPGGKIEAGETKEACLIREIREELGIDIEVEQALTPVTHSYPEFTIGLYPFRCLIQGGSISLTEHAQALWVLPSELSRYDWAEADKPIVEELIRLWK